MKRNDNYRYYTEEDVDNIIANCDQIIKRNTVANIFLGFLSRIPNLDNLSVVNLMMNHIRICWRKFKRTGDVEHLKDIWRVAVYKIKNRPWG